ncbi:hypothetical protein GIB67_025952 [Kingdonia uniflora]|uniref:Uncharacterized protein n=1 Tax=Kingdonia uniflora TaxID=39325 RepID=A0A7J7L8B0_9MAGN|nr:hypothetical protein GIB67_025952 [Kingdonia uniflora]
MESVGEVEVNKVLHFGSLNNVIMSVFGRCYDFNNGDDGVVLEELIIQEHKNKRVNGVYEDESGRDLLDLEKDERLSDSDMIAVLWVIAVSPESFAVISSKVVFEAGHYYFKNSNGTEYVIMKDTEVNFVVPVDSIVSFWFMYYYAILVGFLLLRDFDPFFSIGLCNHCICCMLVYPLGLCNHYSSLRLKTRKMCPLDNNEWEFPKYRHWKHLGQLDLVSSILSITS